ncbi:translocation/assembly module TamB, partial [Halomonas sp. 707D7]|nr:translocation/assembly module TamB [Halomonas sp. 707D7]
MNDVATQSPRARKRLSSKRRTWLGVWSVIRLLILIPLWLFGLIALVLGVALSPWGTAQLFSQAEKRGYLNYEAQSGGLLEAFTLQGFRLELGGTRIVIDDLELRWAQDCLLSGRLCLDTLRVDGADIRLAPGADEEPPQEETSPLRITFPFALEVRELVLNGVALRLGNGTLIEWTELATAATAEGQH